MISKNILKLSYLLLGLGVIECAYKSNEVSNLIPIKFKLHSKWNDHPEKTKEVHQLYLEIKKEDNRQIYSYYLNSQKDSLPVYAYTFNQVDSTLIGLNKDTMRVSKIFHMTDGTEDLDMIRYEFSNYPIHGAGCCLFSERFGMLGHGHFHGLKWVLIEWQDNKLDTNAILKKLKM